MMWDDLENCRNMACFEAERLLPLILKSNISYEWFLHVFLHVTTVRVVSRFVWQEHSDFLCWSWSRDPEIPLRRVLPGLLQAYAWLNRGLD